MNNSRQGAGPAQDSAEDSETTAIHEPRRWRDNGWTAQVIKNEDDDGWAVAMTLHGQTEPALVGPWTMGRDKKNPKPLDTAAFNTLVKTAAEVLRRHEQQLQAQLHQQLEVEAQADTGSGATVQRITVSLDIEPDDDDPSARLRAHDADGTLLAEVSVSPGWRLTRASATAWITSGYARPR